MPDLLESIKESVKNYVQKSTTSEGRSALHLVVKTNTAGPVQAVLDTGVPRHLADIHGNTAVHLAAEEGADVALREILTYGMASPSAATSATSITPIELVNRGNRQGETAVHLACRRPTTRCLEVLIEHGGNIYTESDKRKLPIHVAVEADSLEVAQYLLALDPLLALSQTSDLTLLHLAVSREMVQLLLSYGVLPSTRDLDGFTVLHNAVRDRNFNLLLSLLLSNVTPNLVDGEGNTPLHTAVRTNADHIFAKTLIVCGADLRKENSEGCTAYDLAEIQQNRRYQALLLSVGANDPDFLNRGGEVLVSPPGSFKRKESPARERGITRPDWDPGDAAVLSVDGGAIRGLVAVLILQEIEKRTQRRTSELFDWVAGSSTGALLTMGCIYCNKTARDMLPVYMDVKNKVFQGSRPFNSKLLEECVCGIAGTVRMSEVSHPKILVTSSIGQVRPLKLHLFTNYSGDDEYVWKAAMASGAAPTYFAPFDNRYLDGGLIANNPTLIVLTEMWEQAAASDHQPVTPEDAVDGDKSDSSANNDVPSVFQNRNRPRLVVSVGTGLQPVEQVSNIDVAFVPKNPVEAARYMSGAVEIVSSLIDQICRCDGPCVDEAAAWCDMIGAEFCRLQPALQFNIPLGENNDRRLMEMCWETCMYIYSERGTFERLCKMLLPEACSFT